MDRWVGGWMDGNTWKHTLIVQISSALCLPFPFPALILLIPYFHAHAFVLCCLQNQIPGYLCSDFKERKQL